MTTRRVEEQVADGSHQTVNAKGDHGQENVGKSSGGVAFGLERGVIDDQTADPAEEEGQNKAYDVVVIHEGSSFLFGLFTSYHVFFGKSILFCRKTAEIFGPAVCLLLFERYSGYHRKVIKSAS